ncbi:MAG: cytochrome b/b6 domain-containing protein [Rhodocyclaceae bacterium]|nr:cytochrome b/b6 domain-containing protein [Rhodocyclaceae bacterium]
MARKPERLRVWDLPTRVFHWSLAAGVAVALSTGFIGGDLMEVHGKAGIAIAGLIAFRLVWGIGGSTYARFASFVRGPAPIRAALRGEWQGVGHNPLGALSVLGLLGLAAVQVATGLCGNDDIAFTGPLYALVSKDTSDLLTDLHQRGVWLLLALIALHLGAIAFYVRVKKNNLVLPMLTGWTEKPGFAAEPARGGGLIAFLVALGIALAVAWTLAGGLLPPPAPAAAATPNW